MPYIPRICENCGKEFSWKTNYIIKNAGKFCSKACQHRVATIEEYFWKSIQKTPTCWIWMRGKNSGYGRFRFQTKRILAHRFAWELTYGPIPDGLNVLHKCDNPPCCNPEHLFIGTHKDNNDDMRNKGRAAHHVGTQHHMVKLTTEDVLRIRDLSQSMTNKQIALLFNVTAANIYRIVHRLTWKHIT